MRPLRARIPFCGGGGGKGWALLPRLLCAAIEWLFAPVFERVSECERESEGVCVCERERERERARARE